LSQLVAPQAFLPEISRRPQFNECTFRKYLDFKVSGPRGAATLETSPAPIESTTSLFNEIARACAGLLIAEIQFNGIGGSQTYISLTPNSVVAALTFLWREAFDDEITSQ
jgi:hypothetical protein